MSPFRFFIAGFLFFSAWSASVDALAQCSNTVELLRVSPGSSSNTGVIEIRVKTTKPYQAKLIRLHDATETVITTKQGNGSGTVTFNNLPSEALYKVSIEFNDEEKFLCRTRALSDIVLTSRSN